ncbi:hypothetical protein FHG87_017094 [Trinorchestia longiramus]|nr:hypothetical protein FHG87_017094 [Trinorchestia longiramus]
MSVVERGTVQELTLKGSSTYYRLQVMDSDREKFRSYVQKSGIMSTLTGILVKLYEQPQKPDDPLGFIRKELEKSSFDAETIKTLEEKVARLEAEKQELEEQLKSLRASKEAGTEAEA